MNYKEKVYRVETTQKLMQSDDNIEPPHLVQMFYELPNIAEKSYGHSAPDRIHSIS